MSADYHGAGKRLALAGLAAAALSVGYCAKATTNKYFSYHKTSHSTFLAVSSGDGAFGKVEYIRHVALQSSNLAEQVSFSGPFSRKEEIVDGDSNLDSDGIADIVIRDGITARRERDYDTFKKWFIEADRTLAKVHSRFEYEILDWKVQAESHLRMGFNAASLKRLQEEYSQFRGETEKQKAEIVSRLEALELMNVKSPVEAPTPSAATTATSLQATGASGSSDKAQLGK